jgi:hypothetical protein
MQRRCHVRVSLWLTMSLAVLVVAPVRGEVKVITVFEPEGLIHTLRELNPSLGVSAMGNQLVLSGTPEQLAEAEQLVTRLNQPPQMLLIEWRVSQQRDSQGTALGARQGRSGDWQGGGALEQGSEQGQQAWQVRGLSGRPVLLQMGSYQPVSLYRWRGGKVTALLPIVNGLYASATLVGDNVLIRLSSEQTSLRQGLPEQGQSDTELNVTPGQWVEVGGLANSQQRQGTEIGTTSGAGIRQEHQQQTLAIRVTPVN